MERKEIKRRVKNVIKGLRPEAKVKGKSFLDDDLGFETEDSIKELRDAINAEFQSEFDTALKKKWINDCIDVNDLVDKIIRKCFEDDIENSGLNTSVRTIF